jgi:hypothetical protein
MKNNRGDLKDVITIRAYRKIQYHFGYKVYNQIYDEVMSEQSFLSNAKIQLKYIENLKREKHEHC